MSEIPAIPADSNSITEDVQVTVDLEAEPIDWDHAVAKFLLATVRKKSLPATVPPLATPSDDILHISADSPLHASPIG